MSYRGAVARVTQGGSTRRCGTFEKVSAAFPDLPDPYFFRNFGNFEVRSRQELHLIL